METPTPEVDASPPFRSVKEAVSIFGDRLFLRPIPSPPKPPPPPPPPPPTPTIEVQTEPSYERPINPSDEQDTSSSPKSPMKEPASIPKNPKTESQGTIVVHGNEQDVASSFEEAHTSSEIIAAPTPTPTPTPKNPKKEARGNIVHGNDLVMMLMVLRKLEVELHETKEELKVLKEKGKETEVALASLNAELHKSMLKIANGEADERGKARTKSLNNEGGNREAEMRDEERTIRSELMVKSIDSPTLAQILSISDYEGYFKENKTKTRNKLMKKKPIVPLVTDLFTWKKKESPNQEVSEPIFSKMYFS